MDLSKNHNEWNSTRPTPSDFDNYLPWACTQLSVEVTVVITKSFLSEYVSSATSDRLKSRGRTKSKTPSLSDTEIVDENVIPSDLPTYDVENQILIGTVYDNHSNLVRINFLRNKHIPQILIKIIGLLIPFHKHLTSITINSGLHMEGIYEISKFLPMSRITEICLDYTFLREANYYVLLDVNSLRHLSLGKCKITDDVVKTIALKLTSPFPASQHLTALNLSTNRITDVGVKYLAEALRSNRQLSYLNLADNMITDRGAISIFEILDKFPVTIQEIRLKKARNMEYLKKKIDAVLKMVNDLRTNDFEKKVTRKKILKPTQPASKKKNVERDISDLVLKTKSVMNEDVVYYERAETLVKGILGPFEDPFDEDNIEIRDETVYCYGNNTLCYLNLAYNDLTILSLKKLHQVILTQKLLNRTPKGLINVVIDGNFLPELCEELLEIDGNLDTGLSAYRKISINKRRASSKYVK